MVSSAVTRGEPLILRQLQWDGGAFVAGVEQLVLAVQRSSVVQIGSNVEDEYPRGLHEVSTL